MLRHTRPWKVQYISAEAGYYGIMFTGNHPITSACAVGSLHIPLTTGNQSKPHNINIHAVLLAVVHSRAQPQDENSDSEPAGDLVEGELTDKKSAKKKVADKKPTAEVSRLCEVGRSATSVKIANQRVKSEEDSQRKSSNAKVNISRTSSRAGAKKNWTGIKLRIIPNTNVTKSVRRKTNLPGG